MITLPLWLLIIIGIFGLPLLVGVITFLILTIKIIIIVCYENIKDLYN